eukprot:gene1711-33117_t
MLYRPLIRILEDGDREAKKRAAWCIHFLSIAPRRQDTMVQRGASVQLGVSTSSPPSPPDGKIRWSKEERAQTASLLIPLLADPRVLAVQSCLRAVCTLSFAAPSSPSSPPPPGPAEHRFALLQVLWIFGNMAGLDEEVAE